jgi:hypothetical protein
LKLVELFLVLASPKGCHQYGSKCEFVQTLDFIMRKMGTARPRSLAWDPQVQEPHHGWVLKWEFSNAARHMYIPNYPLRDNRQAVTKEKKWVLWFVGKGKARENLGDIWRLAQEYVPVLASIGKLQFMCVDDEPV